MPSPTTYAIVGCGHRAKTFLDALAGPYRAHARIVGFCDSNPGRAALMAARVRKEFPDAGCYGAEEFERLLAERKPERVIVTVPDYLHEEYVCRALERGCDVIVEKPMAIDGASCARIIDTERKSGRRLIVTMNYRFSPVRTLLKQVLLSGMIGAVKSVQFEWRLDTHHGADYFRRWHRRIAQCGGLFVHKASHHFDLVNWWLGALPRRVHATGTQEFYRPETAQALGLVRRGERCTGCAELQRCGFRLDMSKKDYLRQVYADNEHHDGYFRDQCVFGADIDIPDTMNALVDYENGAVLNYSLTAYAPWEGYRVAFEGTRGMIVHTNVERPWVLPDGGLPPAPPEINEIVVQAQFGKPQRLAVPTGEGAHSGGDKIMLERLFGAAPAPDPYERLADARAGAYSVAVGLAANRSVASRRPVDIDEVMKGVARPQYPQATSSTDRHPFLEGAIALETGLLE